MHGDTDAFIIRIWHEALDSDGSIRIWRGAIEHVNTGRRLAFYDLAVTIRFIQEESGIRADDSKSRWQKAWNWLKRKKPFV